MRFMRMIDIELMPVVVIVGVLASMVLPRFNDAGASDDTQIESNERFLQLKQNIDALSLSVLVKDKNVRSLNEDSIAKEIRNIKDASNDVKSYMSYMNVVEVDSTSEVKPFIQWEIKYVHPNKLLVMRTAEEETGAIYDCWMSIGDDLYFLIGEWFKDDKHETGFDQDSKSMGLKKWIQVLEQNAVDGGIIVDVNNQSYVVLDLKPKNIEKMGIFNDMQAFQAKHMEVWIDADSHLIQRAVLRLDGKTFGPEMGNVVLEQYFGAYNSDVVIQKPKNVYDIADAEKVLKPDKGN